MSDAFPKPFFDMLPTPVLVAHLSSEQLNHKIKFINQAFSTILGWSLEEIPDKQSWWHKAYPEEEYRSAIARQWELEVESAREAGNLNVKMNANITTKHQGLRRFMIHTQLDCSLIDNHYVVVFEPLSYSQWRHSV